MQANGGHTAARRWQAALAGWGYPQELLDAAPDDPWRFDPDELPRVTDSGRKRGQRQSPADIAALDALPRRGTVLDVGCGPGGASAGLRRAASVITGVDDRATVLEQFAQDTAAEPGFLRRIAGGAPQVHTVEGRWPDVAGEVEPADVVVCANVLYDVGEDVDSFLAALTDHARVRVVLTLTERHPLAWLTPYLEQLHGLMRPSEPTVDTAIDLVREVTGRAPEVLGWTVHVDPPVDEDAFERRVARRCCVGEDRLDDVRLALHRTPPPDHRRLAALVWPGTA